MSCAAYRQEGELLKELCEEISLSSSDLSMLTGVDRTTVWRWMSGAIKTPVYARTIVDQQIRIAKLVKQVNET